MYRRKRNREKMVLAVRVSGKTADGQIFDELTHTIDIAVGGGRLGGMQGVRLRLGEIVEVRRQQRKAKFRVVWVGEPGTTRFGHVGIQSIDALPNFWGLDLPSQGEVARTIPPLPVAEDRELPADVSPAQSKSADVIRYNEQFTS
jgi:hypothetical protein